MKNFVIPPFFISSWQVFLQYERTLNSSFGSSVLFCIFFKKIGGKDNKFQLKITKVCVFAL